MKWICGVWCVLIGWSSCSKDAADISRQVLSIDAPEGFPEMTVPKDEALTPGRIALGKKLFFDPILSSNNSISCGSCHFQANAFGDPSAVSTGIDGLSGTRNSPPLFNLGWRSHFFRDGGVDDLALSALNPITNPHELDYNIGGIVARLNKRSDYRVLFREAYNDTATAQHVIRALAAFQRILISANSMFDQKFIRNENVVISESAERGYTLFFGEKAGCYRCHGGFNFSTEEFRCNGLFESYTDIGRQRITFKPEDKGKFLVPSLRNIGVTAPYMHNGSILTLEDVIERYNEGGSSFPNKDPFIQPLGLTETEKADLKAFLLSLTDDEFLNNTAFQAY